MSVVEDPEQLNRRVHPEQVKPDGTVSSAAFKDPEMSVDRAALRRVEETLKAHDGYGAVALIAADARALDQKVHADPTLLNPAHALVVGKKTGSISKKLAAASTWVVRIQKDT